MYFYSFLAFLVISSEDDIFIPVGATVIFLILILHGSLSHQFIKVCVNGWIW